jgi:hypothetical protein
MRLEMVRNIVVTLFVLFASVGAVSAQTCTSYPYTLTNGQNADASQVMANFNYVANCVNNLVNSFTIAAEAIVNWHRSMDRIT